METSHRIQADKLRTFTLHLCEAAGTPRDIASKVSEILVNADLKGHTSHGVLHIPWYLESIAQKGLIPDATPEILRETPSTALVDARQGWGHYAAQWSMNLAIEKARVTGMGGVSLTRANHIGRLGEYAEQAAAEGFIGIATGGWGGPGTGGATPYGGADPALSTNPIALGVPSGDGRHFISDFATTMFANAKIRVFQMRGMKLPPGCIVDKHGQPSVNPDDYFDGGRLLVFGGYKGYAFSLLTCLLGGLTGAFNPETRQIGGVFFQAISISAFQPLETYQQNVGDFLDGIRSIPPAPGFSEVLVPGDPERRAFAEGSANGIDLPEAVLSQLKAWGKKLNLEMEL